MQSVTEEGLIGRTPLDPIVSTYTQELTQKEKKVLGTFRNGEINTQPCLSIVSSILSFVPGRQDPAAEPDQQAGPGLLHIPGQPADIRIEAANMLTAIRDNDTFLSDMGRGYLDLAIAYLHDARAREKIFEGLI